jgi:hypothetical protein
MFEIFAGTGFIFWIILVVLAILTPIMIYLIQRNTNQMRLELRKNLAVMAKTLADGNLAVKQPEQDQPKARILCRA